MEKKIINLAKGLYGIKYSNDMYKCIEFAIEGLLKTEQITAKEICDLAVSYGTSKKDLVNTIYDKYVKHTGA